MMFRFSRDKRFFSQIQFEEFAQVAVLVVEIVKTARPGVELEILTTEDLHTYQYSKVTFVADEVTEALKGRKSYTFEDFTEEVWNRSMSVKLTFTDDCDPKPFMICLSLDKLDEPRSMKFYGQAVEQKLVDNICDTFSRPTFFFSIGDGYSKPSDFNLAFGQQLTGIRL